MFLLPIHFLEVRSDLASLPLFEAKKAKPLAPLHIVGKQLYAGKKPFHIQGVDICSLEWTSRGDHILQSVGEAAKWHANFIRIPLCEDRWFGKAPDNQNGGKIYRSIVGQVVQKAADLHMYVLLDLHWSDDEIWGQNIGQHTLPDMHSLKFWKSCARKFANVPNVAFDLYNEPIKAPWSVWRNGGMVADTWQGKVYHYQSPGMQGLLDAIRGVGAKNLVSCGGLGYASQMNQMIPYKLDDPTGNGVIYSNHFYPGWESVGDWEARVSKFAKVLPFFVGEFGAGPQTLPMDDPARRITQTLAVLKEKGWNWVAWCMHPQAGPCLIENWNYKPTPYFGVYVKKALNNQVVSIPPQPTVAKSKYIFNNGYQNQWQNWSNAQVTEVPANGLDGTLSKTILQVTIQPNQQVQWGDVPFSGVPYSGLKISVDGGSDGGQFLIIGANIMNKSSDKHFQIGPLPPNQWKTYVIPLHQLGVDYADNLKSFTVWPENGKSSHFLVSQIEVIGRKPGQPLFLQFPKFDWNLSAVF